MQRSAPSRPSTRALLQALAALACGALLAACGHPASRDECDELFAKTAELELHVPEDHRPQAGRRPHRRGPRRRGRRLRRPLRRQAHHQARARLRAARRRPPSSSTVACDRGAGRAARRAGDARGDRRRRRPRRRALAAPRPRAAPHARALRRHAGALRRAGGARPRIAPPIPAAVPLDARRTSRAAPATSPTTRSRARSAPATPTSWSAASPEPLLSPRFQAVCSRPRETARSLEVMVTSGPCPRLRRDEDAPLHLNRS